MASFKIARGLSTKLPTTKVDGALYFCTDTHELYIDYKNSNNTIVRVGINASQLEGATLAQELKNSTSEIPSSALISSIKSTLENSIAGVSSSLSTHTANKSNPHGVTKSQVGLGNVNNTSDANKPVSTAQATAIANAKTEALNASSAVSEALSAHTSNKNNPHGVTLSQLGGQSAITGAASTVTSSNLTASRVLVSNSSGKIAASSSITTTELGYLDGVTSKIQTQLDSKASNEALLAHIADTDNPHEVTKSTIGLGNVENKSSATIRGELTKANVTTALGFTPISTAVKGAANGLAELDANGRVPTAQLPSYVDDVIEGTYVSSTSFKNSSGTVITGETGKIYVDTSTNKTYRWSGSAFVEISASLALGTTSSTAYRGDYGNTAYTHSQSAHAPSNAEKNQNAFSNVKVGSTTITADTATDTLELVAGSNITLTPDATNDKITIAATDTTYTSLKNPYSLTIQGNGTTLTNGTYDGSAAKTVNITPSSIGAAASSHGTHVTWSTTTPKAAGTAAVGSETKVARGDHVHPAQTTVSGNAGTATKLATARTINGMSFDGSAAINNYGVCSTAAGTAAKTVTVGSTFSLVTGAQVIVKFTNANSVASPTLNVNSTGAKPIYKFGTTAAGTSTIATGWAAGAVQTFTYDGTGWFMDYWYNSTYSTYSLGIGYGTCSTAAATAAKVVTLSNYTLVTGGIVAVKFTYAVPANATMNINSKGAKDIYHRGAKITANVIQAGDIATFIYDGTRYQLIANDNNFSKMTSNLTISKSSPYLYLKNTSTARTARMASTSDKYLSLYNEVTVDASNNRTALWLGPETSSLTNLLSINHVVNGTANTYRVLHTGNIADYAVPGVYTWKRRKVNYSTTLGTTETVSMTTYSGSSSKTCSFSYSTSYSVDRDSNTLTLPNATNASVSHDSSASTSATSTSATLNALKGKYWKYNNTFYYTPSNAADSVVKTTSRVVGGNAQVGPIYATTQTMSIAAQPVTFSGITYGDWEIVTSTSATAYPETFTYSGGYEYIKYGGMDRRQTSTAIKHMTFYGTGAAKENTIYVDEIPTLFIIYEGSTPILFKWGHQGIVLLSNTSSGITTISATYNTANKSITFNKVFAKDIYPMNAAKRYHCYLIYG